jgi:NADP-dependent 3-hydroxy acid dehydrogenase YdfG
MTESPVYIVLGATGGIGSSISKKLSERGALLVLAARGIDNLNQLANETGGKPYVMDATNYDEVEV